MSDEDIIQHKQEIDMLLNQARTILGVSILMLTLVSGAAYAKCGGHGGHGGGHAGLGNVGGRSAPSQTGGAQPQVAEGRSAFIADYDFGAPGFGDSKVSAPYLGRDLGLGGHHRAGR
jgi:hypothetical protein